ncbi:DEAD/DEAH box helicase [Streptomyces palmae]|uniref:RNA helicase n=2 Tax=Streptomyces palmae TaxID=1701085 RepID=A0A4Z0HBG6_9ACTN|nr:DEAD/DEAH box helicase [Streptomyces palmae]TGB13277.1 DEAD/DEAH box helicase [Streptomyces palmae]
MAGAHFGAVRDPLRRLVPRLTEEASILSTFRELGILPETAEALEAVGITSPFPIQEMTLPVALAGTDVIGQAKTGTGKTLGFGLPLLERVIVPADVEAGRAKPEQLTDTPQALVVVPTRELCQQVTNDLLTAGKVRNVRVLSIYGGRAYEPQVEALKKGVDVVVGTPGRLLDLAGQKKLNLSAVKALVLDEADEMLDLGFLPDVEKIIQLLPATRQTMLFSATMPGQVISLARRYMSQPTHIRATAPDDEGATVANITQHVFRAHSMDKPEVVARVLQAEGRGLAMIFCRTKRTAADIADQLSRRGFASGAVHGDLGQGAREQALRAFRNGKVDVLVCTDVAARGIDVEGVTHVINYQSPEDEKTYLHRIGRTGRAGASGTAITLVDWDDIPRWQLINKALDLSFHEPVETYSTSPHLFELLNIPQGTTGVLPRSERTRAGLAAEEIEDLGETGGRGQRGSRGGRGGRDARDGAEERPQRTRTPRQRRRTRGGMALDGAATAPAADTAAAEAPADAPAEPRTPRRRRRTRGGAAGTRVAEQAVQTVEATETVPAVATADPVEAVEAVEVTEAPAKPRRRRTRAAKPAAEAVLDTVESAETAAAAKAPEGAEVAEATEVAEAPAKPRRRTRTTKAAASAAEAAVDTAEGAEVAEAPVAKPRRRTTKAAAPAAEAAVDTAEGAEAAEAPAKPRRRRTTKATASATEAAEAAVDTAEGAEATEAPAKPRRRRTTKATASATEAAEAAVDTAEGAEAAEAPATKPRRRTTKAAAAKSADAAQGAEAGAEEAKPVRRRRTTKAAATAPASTPEA